MDAYLKNKIKKRIKARWKIVLGSAIFLTVGVVLFLVGMTGFGWSIIKWLQSWYAIATLVCVIGGILLFVWCCSFKRKWEILNG